MHHGPLGIECFLARAQAGAFGLMMLVALGGCHSADPSSIAVIPRTSGTMLWEPENLGAQTAAAALHERIYWNASTREDDVDGQIALVERVAAGEYRGLVLAPDHSQALITPVRRVLATGRPIVIVGSPLPIQAPGNLSYVLNDEVKGGRLAADRVALLLHGSGDIALTGIDPDINGILNRARSFEQALARFYPGVHIVARRTGTFNVAHEQESAEEMLRAAPSLNAIVALNSSSMRGAISTIQGSSWGHPIKVIGFDPESLPFENVSLDSVILQDTRRMGERAVEIIHARLRGAAAPSVETFEPVLVTRENATSSRVQMMVSSDLQPAGHELQRSAPE